jgi:hypothetical protein
VTQGKPPKERKLGGTRDSSYCTIRFGEMSRQRLPEKIQAVLSLLKPHRELLQEFFPLAARSPSLSDGFWRTAQAATSTWRF